MDNKVSNSKEYNEIRKQAETWPNWQKEYYNNTFATSKNAKKIPLTKELFPQNAKVINMIQET